MMSPKAEHLQEAAAALGPQTDGETEALLENPTLFNPTLFNPSLFNPSLFNPTLFIPSLFIPSLFNPTLFLVAWALRCFKALLTRLWIC